MKKGSGMRQLLAVLLAVWMAAAGALGVAAQEEKKRQGAVFPERITANGAGVADQADGPSADFPAAAIGQADHGAGTDLLGIR